MDKIEIKNNWKDKVHLRLLDNAVKSLSEFGVISELEAERIKLAIKEQDDEEEHTDL